MLKTSSNFTKVLLISALTLAFCFDSYGQKASRPDRGTMPNGSFSMSNIENINLLNGNVNLSIPLASLPPIAGGKLSWTVSAQYNSKIWNVTRAQANDDPLTWAPYSVDYPGTESGWSVGNTYFIEFRNANDDFQRIWYPGNSGIPAWDLDLINNNQWWKVVLHMPDGSQHELRPTDHSPYSGTAADFLKGFYKVKPTGSPMRYYSVDGTYLFARISNYNDWTLYLPDGTQIIQSPAGFQRIQDTNGNKIKIFGDANGYHYLDEQSGREIRITYNPAGQGASEIRYKTVGGIEHHVDVVWGTSNVQGQLYSISQPGCEYDGLTQVLSSQIDVVREIVFPQTEPGVPQRKFVFTYNSDTSSSKTDNAIFYCPSMGEPYTRTVSNGLGEVSRVQLPSGSFIDYTYKHDGVSTFSPFGIGDYITQNAIDEKKLSHDGIEEPWDYDIGDSFGTVENPDGSFATEVAFCSLPNMPGCGSDKSGLTFRSVRPFTIVERHWTSQIFSGGNNQAPNGLIPFNPVVDREFTTLTNSANQPLKMSAKTFTYDYNGNVTQEKHYDWFDPNLVTRDSEGVPTGVPAGATLLRTINNTHYNQAATSSSGNVYAKRSVSTGAPFILNAPKDTSLGPSSVQLSYDGQAYGVAPTVGNLTAKSSWLDTDARWITTSKTYDVYGNVATTTDARGKVTQLFYDDSTHALPTRIVVDPQNGTGTQTTTTVYDFWTSLVTSQTDANGQQSTIDYTNQLLNAVDPFGRPGVTKKPAINIGGTNHQRRVTTTYLDSSRQMIVASDWNSENDKLLKTRTTTDMLGRPVLTEQTEDGTNYTISVKNAYLDMGRVTLLSNAMRSTASSTDSWTRITKDTAGRVVEVVSFGGATQPAWTGTSGIHTGTITTAYDSNFVTVTDQAGKLRRSMVDAAGRLRRVDEPNSSGSLGSTTAPEQPTSYTYDVLNHLVTVTQGSQTRTFSYDSLSRLRSAVNPESGTINYLYDDNANLLVKTDARGVSVHFEYDAINRVTRRWYNGSNSTSATTHNSPALAGGVATTNEAKSYYDTQTLPGGAPSYSRGSAVGRLVAQTYGTGSNGDYYAYDVLGQPTLKIQQTGALNYQTSATYSLSGALDTLTYPSGHTVTNIYDQAGRLTTFSGNLGDGTMRIYSNGILYSPLGGLVKEQFGTIPTPIYNKLFYNSRGQLAEIRASTSYTGPTDYTADRGAIVNKYSANCSTGICSGLSMPENNGNLLKQEIHIPGQTMRYQEYAYDSLNRLNSVREVLDGGAEQWKQAFTYDRWGNRTINPGLTYGTGINNKAFNVNAANNRLEVPAGQSGVMQYDAAGNLTNDTYTGAGNRTYDGDNKMTSAWGGNNQAQLYSYDVTGQRVKRTIDGVETWQVYGLGGELLADYPANGAATSPQKEYGYRSGQLLITAEPGSGSQSTQNVSWTNGVGVSISGNNLTRTMAGDGWSTGAASTQSIASGDGYVEYTVSETNKTRSVGLTTATSGIISYQYINYGFYLANDGQLLPHEGFGTYGSYTYATGDKLRISIEGGVVKFRKNGTLLRTSSVAPTYPLYAGAAISSNAGTVTAAVITAGGPENVGWTSGVGVSISGNNLTRTMAGDGWSTGARSTQSITSGDGYVEYTVSETNKTRSVGLTTATSGIISYQYINYGFYLANDGQLLPHEGFGTYGSYTYATGDKLRISIEGGVVKFRKNGTLLRTSSVAPTYPLYAGAAISSNAGTVTGAVFSLGGDTSSAQLRWLVSDQLGTPRIIFDLTGSLANTKRHDYLPFGEELVPPTGGRTTAMGYASGDGVRQQFTGKERDIETQLDYFGARYYSSSQGRFTSVDPSARSIRSANPQTWNRYLYAMNNPLIFVDSNGKWPTPTHDKLVSRAFDTLNDEAKRAIQKGSEKVDRDGLNPKTMWEKNAPQHAMTPQAYVRALGDLPSAQVAARKVAVNFIETNLDLAARQYTQAYNSRTGAGLAVAFQTFGSAMHTVMDNWSPMHRDFQLYDGTNMNMAFGPGPLVQFGLDMLDHANGEEREPTEDEANHMIDEMRLRFYETFGEDAYNRAVSQAEREATADRLARMNDMRLLLYLRPVNRPKPEVPR